MFVVIYTPGPAWLAGKSVSEQPFYREHGRFMHQLFFTDQRLIMGGPFLDNQGALGILDVANEAQALEILAHDPAVLAGWLCCKKRGAKKWKCERPSHTFLGCDSK